MPLKPATAPTDRSIPPLKITSVMPMAAIPRKALSVSRLVRTRQEKNPR